MAQVMRFLGYHYERCFRSHPVATLAFANGFCSICGDGAAQLIPMLTSEDPVEAQHSFDFARLLRYFVFGLNMGPIGGKWNEILERRLQSKSRMSDQGGKSALDTSVEMSLMGDVTGNEPSLPTTTTSQPTRSSPTLSFRVIIKMVLADQLIMAPFSLILFLSYMAITEGVGLIELQNRIQRLFWKLLIANWQVWPLIQLINFRFMPLRLRVPFASGCGILWTIFLSYAASG